MSSTADAPSALPLPTPLTRLIGREQELLDLERLLGSARLLTLTGAGGSGKTRLALALAERCPGHCEVRAWADLAAVAEPGFVAQSVLAVLGGSETSGVDAADAIVETVGTTGTLLVLDNCEHLIDACAGLAEALLIRCPGLTIVATSREALGVPGEVAWLVPPLALEEARALFADRAQSVLPGFVLSTGNGEAVDTICAGLDGMPLAIELAAARVRVLSPSQIAGRLGDALGMLRGGARTTLPRQRTLRATIDWSYHLLTEREQVLLRRLAVFTGSFSLDAVEALCGDPPLELEQVLDAVAGLVDKSLVVLLTDDEGARYRLLEAVRQYADELLEASGERAELRARHAAWFTTAAEGMGPALFGGPADLALRDAISRDAGNYRGIAEWVGEDPSRIEMGLRLGYALHWYLYSVGRFEEGRQRLGLLLRQPVAVDPRVRGRALVALGHIALWQGHMGEMVPAMEEAVRLLGDDPNVESRGYALTGLGAARYLEGRLSEAVALLDEARGLADTLPDHILGALNRYWGGRAAMDSQQFELAERLFAEASEIGRRRGHRQAQGYPMLMRGQLALAHGEPSRALRRFVEGLVIVREAGDSLAMAMGLEGVASAMAAEGQAASAALFLGAAAAVRERKHIPRPPSEQEVVDRVVTQVRQVLDDETYRERVARGHQLDGEHAVLRAIEQVPDTGTFPAVPRPRPRPGTPPALEVHALGPLVVRVEGAELPPSAWGSARARELLPFLLAHPRGVSRDQVGLAFWPESSAAQVRNTFHVSLHRLRRALGHPDWIDLEQDRYRVAPSLAVRVDVRQFEDGIREGTRLAERDDPRARATLEGALELYAGDYLELEQPGDWALDERERLRQRFLAGALALSALQLLDGDARGAADTCQRLLAREPLHEEGLRRLMTAHARLGDRSQGMRLYQQLVERLRAELDAEPDRGTTDLFRRLQAGQEV